MLWAGGISEGKDAGVSIGPSHATMLALSGPKMLAGIPPTVVISVRLPSPAIRQPLTVPSIISRQAPRKERHRWSR